jgi:hypothetical protein
MGCWGPTPRGCVMEGGGYVGRIVCDRCTRAAPSYIAYRPHSRQPQTSSVFLFPDHGAVSMDVMSIYFMS